MTDDAPTTRLLHADCLAALRELPADSVDAVITDPPYGLANTSPAQVAAAVTRWAAGERDFIPAGVGYMGQSWDAFVPPPAVWDECLRVLRPGGHLLCFAGTRTVDLMGLSIRLAGFDLRESLAWLHSQGFPKSKDLGAEVDRLLGAERPVVGTARHGIRTLNAEGHRLGTRATSGNQGESYAVTAPATAEGAAWAGWRTTLKPGHEPILLARKPLAGSVAANLLAHRTGALNIAATRLGEAGRWPATAILDDGAAADLDDQQAGAGRFFYVAKASAAERPTVGGVRHPTVKPLTLMRHLVRLVTPPGGTVLDPFAGSGTTLEAAALEGFDGIGVEREADYLPLIAARLARAADLAA